MSRRPPDTRRGRDQVIVRAYLDTDALKRPCITCGAEVNEWCTTPDERVRRIPCIRRATAPGGDTGDETPAARDFSQPIHEGAPR